MGNACPCSVRSDFIDLGIVLIAGREVHCDSSYTQPEYRLRSIRSAFVTPVDTGSWGIRRPRQPPSKLQLVTRFVRFPDGAPDFEKVHVVKPHSAVESAVRTLEPDNGPIQELLQIRTERRKFLQSIRLHGRSEAPQGQFQVFRRFSVL